MVSSTLITTPVYRLSAVLGLAGAGAFRLVRVLDGRYAVALGCPRPEVDHLAPIRAEWTPGTVWRPQHGLATGWAVYGAWFWIHAVLNKEFIRPRRTNSYRLQKMSSNSTSVSAGLGRCIPSCVVKRILSAYLFALISGTNWYSRFRRILTIWAMRPAIICW